MEQRSSWEAVSHLTTQEISNSLWILQVHCCVHKSTQLARVKRHMKPVHMPTLFLSIYFNNILLSTLMSPKSCLIFTFFDQNFICISHFLCMLHVRPISLSLSYHCKYSFQKLGITYISGSYIVLNMCPQLFWMDALLMLLKGTNVDLPLMTCCSCQVPLKSVTWFRFSSLKNDWWCCFSCIDRWFEVNRSCPEHPGD